MTERQKRLFFISGSLAGLLFLAAAALVILTDVNSYKPEIEASVSSQLGMDFKINGRIRIVLLPNFGLSMGDVTVKNKGTDLATAKKVRVGIKPLPLIRGRVLISECELVAPIFSFVRGEDGAFNFESRSEQAGKGKALPATLHTVAKFRISGATLVYSDKKSGDTGELKDFDLSLKDLSFAGRTFEELLGNISLSGDFACKSVRMRDFRAANLQISIKGGKGRFAFAPIVVDAFGGTVRGEMQADVTGDAPHFRISFKTAVFSLDEPRKAASQKKTSGDRPELRDLELDITDLSFPGEKDLGLLLRASLSGNFRCGSLKQKEFEVSDLTFAVKGERGLYNVSPVRMNFYGGAGEGSIRADLTGKVPQLKMRYYASGFSSERFLEGFSRKKIVKGEMDFFMDLETEGRNADEMKRRVRGEVLLKGENLLLYNLDLDRLLSKIEDSRSLSLVDIGAYFFTGPLGTLVTKGYNFADIAADTKGGESVILRLISKWRVKKGVAGAEDVALATKQNRLALKGDLDFVEDRFDDVTVAVLNKKGCATLTQKIYGPFRKPQVEKISVMRSVVEPVLSLVEKARRLIEGEKCTVFYAGSVKHPE